MEQRQLIKAKELVQRLGAIGVSTVYRLAAQGEIPSYRIGPRGVRFDIEEVRSALRRARLQQKEAVST